MAVYRRNGLLKASVMSAGNAHRLGANEAPPAILSVFLGTQLSAILDKIEFSQSDEAIQLDKKTGFRMDGITHEGVQKGKIPPCRIGYLISVSNRDTNKSRVPNTFWTPSFLFKVDKSTP